MKQYRCIKNSPWSSVGTKYRKCEQIKSREVWMAESNTSGPSFIGNPAYWTDIFEEIEVKSDQQLLHEYFMKLDWSNFCHKLLSENAINPEFLKKLRDES